jgi:hypothetical protein
LPGTTTAGQPQEPGGLRRVAQRRDVAPRAHPADVAGEHEQIGASSPGAQVRAEIEGIAFRVPESADFLADLDVDVAEVEDGEHAALRAVHGVREHSTLCG